VTNKNTKFKFLKRPVMILTLISFLMLFSYSAFAVTTNIQDTYIRVDTLNATYINGDGSKLTGLEQGELILYFADKSSSCSSCPGNKTLTSIYNATEVTLSGTSLADGSTLLGEWITDVGVPNINLIEGNMRVHVAGKKSSSSKIVQFYYEVYKTNSTGGNETLLATSEYTSGLTTTRTDYSIWILLNETMIDTTNRIRVKGYAYVTGTGVSPDIDAYIQGASKTRLVMPVGAVSVENFVPYSGAVNNLNFNNRNATNINLLSAVTINQNGNNVVDDSDIGSSVQAYDADLADLADGTLSKSKVQDSTNWDLAYLWSNTNHTLWDWTYATLLAKVSNQTGTGAWVFATSPTLVTPILGVATGTSLTLSGFINQTETNGNVRYFGNGCYEKVNSTGVYTIC